MANKKTVSKVFIHPEVYLRKLKYNFHIKMFNIWYILQRQPFQRTNLINIAQNPQHHLLPFATFLSPHLPVLPDLDW